MNQLDRLEDFPLDYRNELASHKLAPLWPSLLGVLPPACPPAGATPSMKSHTLDSGAIALKVNGDLICTGAADVALNSGAAE